MVSDVINLIIKLSTSDFLLPWCVGRVYFPVSRYLFGAKSVRIVVVSKNGRERKKLACVV